MLAMSLSFAVPFALFCLYFFSRLFRFFFFLFCFICSLSSSCCFFIFLSRSNVTVIKTRRIREMSRAPPLTLHDDEIELCSRKESRHNRHRLRREAAWSNLSKETELRIPKRAENCGPPVQGTHNLRHGIISSIFGGPW
jgi:hypothetical protein